MSDKKEPVVFKIYKPTPPRFATPDVRDAELPWVYDQDPSSGNVASMWVTPVYDNQNTKYDPPIYDAFQAYCKTLHPLWNTRISRTEAEGFFKAGYEAATLEKNT